MPAAHYINVEMREFISSRHFCNKIWQAFRFITSKVPKNHCYQFDEEHTFQVIICNLGYSHLNDNV